MSDNISREKNELQQFITKKDTDNRDLKQKVSTLEEELKEKKNRLTALEVEIQTISRVNNKMLEELYSNKLKTSNLYKETQDLRHLTESSNKEMEDSVMSYESKIIEIEKELFYNQKVNNEDITKEKDSNYQSPCHDIKEVRYSESKGRIKAVVDYAEDDDDFFGSVNNSTC